MEVTFLSMVFFLCPRQLEIFEIFFPGRRQPPPPSERSLGWIFKSSFSWRTNFLFTCGSQTGSGPTDGDKDESDDDDHVHHLLDTGEERLGPTLGHHFSFLIVWLLTVPSVRGPHHHQRRVSLGALSLPLPRLLTAKHDAIFGNTTPPESRANLGH